MLPQNGLYGYKREVVLLAATRRERTAKAALIFLNAVEFSCAGTF